MRTTPADGGSFEVALILAAIALPCSAFAWDGLVRKRTLLQVVPWGGRSVTIKGVMSILGGVIALAVSLASLFLALGFYIVGTSRCRGAFTCLIGSVEVPAWIWVFMCAGWFFFVWLRQGDPHKRVLVYGMWYHADKVARSVNQQLQRQARSPIPADQLYVLESHLLNLMHRRRWVKNGPTWFDGRQKQPSIEVPAEEMLQAVLHEPAYHHASESERAAIQWLLEYFHAQSLRAERLSPIRRYWVATGQIGKGMVYGRRAM